MAASYHCGSADKAIKEFAYPRDAVPHNGGILYKDLKKQLLQDNNTSFEDPDFPAADESLFFSRESPIPIVWKRPHEITENPKLFVDGASRFDITQGMCGESWLLASVVALTQDESLVHQVVPPDQSFNEGYCGAFRCRFWQYGRWEEVIVDDRLPTYNNQLVFLHSETHNEFWPALLEKAYAKLVGSYEALKGGQTSEAMEDFTGGVTETWKFTEIPEDFCRIMERAAQRQSLMCSVIEPEGEETKSKKMKNGLITNHAYSVTDAKKIVANDVQYHLVRCRNPWGKKREWNGAWSDNSKEWNYLTQEQKEKIGLKFDHDGEFWMNYDDFVANFTKIEICMLSPDSAGDADDKLQRRAVRSWAMECHQGSWNKHVSAGGCRNFPDKFYTNPQYRISLEDPDEEDDVDGCTIVIGLIQKQRKKHKNVGVQNLTIGFAIYRVEDDADEYMENDRLNKDFFLYHKSCARSANFVNYRELTGRFTLPKGEYCIMPSTFKPNEEGDFLLRIFSEKKQKATAMDTKTHIEVKTKKATPEENKAFDDKFKPFFEHMAGNDELIDAFELQAVTNFAFKKELGQECSLDTCRSMVAKADRDRSGRLEYSEFRDLWLTVMNWKKHFDDYDKDETGDISASELRNALAKLGFKLGTPALASLVFRYANKQGNVNFDYFIQICCRISSAFESYTSLQGKAFSLDDYIMSAIYT